MVTGHRIKNRIDSNTIHSRLLDYAEDEISCTEHTLFRLSEKQRKVFNCGSLKKYLLEKSPILAGIQQNDKYALFYKHGKNRYIRIIIDIKPHRVDIVTFYVIERLPVIK